MPLSANLTTASFKNKSTEPHGYSFLEQIVILPILLGIIFGAIDINTIIQAHSALTAGLKTALRCVVTVDGRCVNTSAAPAPRLYNWYGGSANISYSYQLKDYDADVSWISYPTFTATNVQARVLGSVSYSQPAFNYAARTNYFLMRALYPYLSGTESRNPRFVYLNQQSVNYPRTPVSTSPANLSTLNLRARAGTNDSLRFQFSFELSDRDQTQQCFQAANGFNTSSGSSQPNTNMPCASSGAVPVIIHLLGDKSVDANTAGQVEITVRGPRINRNLGGQEIAANNLPESGASNFVPRGAIKDRNYVDQTILDDGAELGTYGYSLNPNSSEPGTPLMLEPGQQYEIELRLVNVSGAGSLSWTPTSLHLYTADYRSVPPSNVNLGCFSNEQQAANSPNFQIYMTQPATDNTPCNPQTQTQTCPNNFGVSDKADVDGLIRNSAQAELACPAPANASSINWSENLINIAQHVSWDYINCGSSPVIPTSLAAYQKLIWPPIPDQSLTVYKPLPTYQYSLDKTPTWALTNDPAYSCGAFRIDSTCFDEDKSDCNRQINMLDLLNGHEETDLGACAAENAKTEFDADALQIIGTSSYFLQLRERPTGSAHASTPPENTSCTAYRMQYAPGSFEKLNQQPMLETEIPPQCTGPGAINCYSQFVGFGADSHNIQPDFKTDLAAEHYGFGEIQAALPAARFGCSGPYCTHVSIAPVINGQQINFEAEASMEVPLNLLFGKTLRFSSKAKDSDQFEANFG